ncbi:hypothetical protein HYW74_02160 [Candidatus Pacearchaeota archaeon]|nr:hypothetical protein [Candidatus Pacearchaeota archaeon]
MKNKEWAIIIAVVLVVAVAVSLITANITGNAVFKAAKGYGPSAKEVYTVGEVDSKLNNINNEFSKNLNREIEQAIIYLYSCRKYTTILSSADNTKEFSFPNDEYIVKLVGASDTSATILITDSDGKTEQKEIAENNNIRMGKTMLGEKIGIAVLDADESNQKLRAKLALWDCFK